MVQSVTQGGFETAKVQHNTSPIAQGIRIMEAPAHTGYAKAQFTKRMHGL